MEASQTVLLSLSQVTQKCCNAVLLGMILLQYISIKRCSQLLSGTGQGIYYLFFQNKKKATKLSSPATILSLPRLLYSEENYYYPALTQTQHLQRLFGRLSVPLQRKLRITTQIDILNIQGPALLMQYCKCKGVRVGRPICRIWEGRAATYSSFP